MGVEDHQEAGGVIQEFSAVVPFTRAEADDDMIRITGVASTWDEDAHGERIIGPEAFKNLDKFQENPIMLAQHDHNRPLGHFEHVRLTRESLNVGGLVVNKADPFYPLIRAGSIRTFSVGGKARYQGDTITEVFLEEISVVTLPANQRAQFSLAKALAKAAPTEEEKEPEDLKWSRAFFVREYADLLKRLREE